MEDHKADVGVPTGTAESLAEAVEWRRGGKKAVLDAYLKLHDGKLGAHWLWCAIMQINAGDSEESVLRDFGYVRDSPAPTESEVK
jgi:hypothetical protein